MDITKLAEILVSTGHNDIVRQDAEISVRDFWVLTPDLPYGNRNCGDIVIDKDGANVATYTEINPEDGSVTPGSHDIFKPMNDVEEYEILSILIGHAENSICLMINTEYLQPGHDGHWCF